MKKLALPAIALLAAACGDVERSELVPTDGVSVEQRQAFQALEATSGKEWRWVQDEVRRSPLHLSAPRTGVAELARGADPVKTTLGVLDQHRALFKLRNPGVELAVKKTETDELGITHARFQQLTHGIRVVGAEVLAHYDAVGHLSSVDTNYVPDLESVDVNPAFDATAARAKVVAEITAATGAAEAVLEADEGELVVKGGQLAYVFTVSALEASPPAIWVSTLDAKTGALVRRIDRLQTIKASGTGVLGNEETFEVAAAGQNFVMTDGSQGSDVKTYTARQTQTTPGTQVQSNSTTTWDRNVPGAGAAVDAHVNAATVLKYFKTVHQRNAVDGAGGALVSTVHFSRDYENAAWTGTGMIYGDGATIFRALSAAVDVVGHEFAHGVTQATSQLDYESQAGALNEAISDMFGAFIEHAVKPDTAKNWQIGEAIVKSGKPLRDMSNPTGVDDAQPAHMTEYVQTQQDNGGVHINSGIINNAGWLMTVGGTNPTSKVKVAYGLGWEKSEKLWYRANTKNFLQTTNFAQAAQALVQAAKDLSFTTNEQNIVECAFKATGIVAGACATLTDPTQPQTAAPTADAVKSADEAGDDSGVSQGDTTAPAAPTRRRAIVSSAQGCNGGGHGGGIGALPLALLVLTLRRRRAS